MLSSEDEKQFLYTYSKTEHKYTEGEEVRDGGSRLVELLSPQQEARGETSDDPADHEGEAIDEHQGHQLLPSGPSQWIVWVI